VTLLASHFIFVDNMQISGLKTIAAITAHLIWEKVAVIGSCSGSGKIIIVLS
jgi:hypothetical protein